MITQSEPAAGALKGAASEARTGAIRTALAAGKGMAHQGVGYIRDELAAKVLPRRLASLVSSRRHEQESADAKHADGLTAVEIEDLNAVKILVEKYGADRLRRVIDLLD